MTETQATQKKEPRVAKMIRVGTTAPIMAAILIGLMYFLKDGAFVNAAHAGLAVLFLSILPVLAYPVSWMVPALRRKGREGQRSLAIAFSMAGYLLGCVVCAVFGGAPIETLIYMTYLISGVAIAVLSWATKFKASGHACGVAGPVAVLSICLSPWFMLGGVILCAVYWSSLKLKRHTLPQLLGGTAIPIAAMAISALILGLI